MPQLSVTVGTVLAIASMGVLIYFIHHASTIIQASHVITQVSNDLANTIDRLFPENIGQSAEKEPWQVEEIPANFEEASPVKATTDGYVQAIDDDELMKITQKYNILVLLKTRPGKFIIKGSDIALVLPGERVDMELIQLINDAFIVGHERTEYQEDAEFPINQLVEIALRPLSPGINDPFTAIGCIDRLSAGLSRIAQRDFPSPYRYDDEHNLRLIVEVATFEGLVNSAFNQIRQ